MSGKHQWLKFWPQDWQNDTALATCSIGARGLWISMICVMHTAEPYGHMTVNGKPATTRHIASLARISDKEATKLLEELEGAGVFSRANDGTIYSRRMVRDEEQSEAGRDAVSKRWGRKNGAKVTPGASSPPTTHPTTTPITPPNRGPYTLEAEAESDSEPNGSAHSGPDGPAPVGAGQTDARSELWGVGLGRLRSLTGKSDPQSRRFLGGLLKSARDDCAAVNAALAEAADLRPIDPAAWLTRRIRGPDDAKIRNGFLAIIADEGMPSVEKNRFLRLEDDHGQPH